MHIHFCTLPQIQLLSFRTEFAVLSIKPTTTQRQNLCEEEKLKEVLAKQNQKTLKLNGIICALPHHSG